MTSNREIEIANSVIGALSSLEKSTRQTRAVLYGSASVYMAISAETSIFNNGIVNLESGLDILFAYYFTRKGLRLLPPLEINETP